MAVPNLTLVIDDEMVLTKARAEIAVRLADEGIPVRAIARAMQHHPTPVRDVILCAIGDGRLVALPREDWPPGVLRHNRLGDGMRQMSSEDFVTALMQVFKFTATEARMFAPLVRKATACTKEHLHEANMLARPDADASSLKMVDVIICKTRKKLKVFEIEITTLRGRGYELVPEMIAKVRLLIGDYFALSAVA